MNKCNHNFIFSHTETINSPSSSLANFTEYIDVVICNKCGKVIRQKQNETITKQDERKFYELVFEMKELC